jgi:hypothetical protein
MGALIPFGDGALPPARRALVSLNKNISAAESMLERLVRGRDQLRAELSRADTARAALDTMVTEDASSLSGRIRSGASWALSHFGSARAMNLVASLAESQVQLGIGSKALAEIESEVQQIEREVSDLKARKADAVRAVLVEASAGFRDDMLSALDDMRQAMTVLAALDRITAKSDGSFRPNERIVVEIPALGTMPAQAVVAPDACIDRAQSVLRAFTAELDSDPLADVEDLKFPHVIGSEDDGRVLYDRLTVTERLAVDAARR